MDVQLSPPWYTLRNMIAYTIGESSLVSVSELEEDGDAGYDINIYVKKSSVAKAIREILPLNYKFGEVVVKVIVHDTCKGLVVNPSNQAYNSPEELAKVFCIALECNILFVGTILTEGKINPMESELIGDVVVVIDKEVVQFYNDDISNLCSDFNGVAADVFSQVVKADYPTDLKISFSTYNHKCMKNFDSYCSN